MNIYFLRAEETGLVKIGKANDVAQRAHDLQAGSALKLTVIRTIPGDLKTERWLHNHFKALRRHREWFEFSEEMMAIEPPASNDAAERKSRRLRDDNLNHRAMEAYAASVREQQGPIDFRITDVARLAKHVAAASVGEGLKFPDWDAVAKAAGIASAEHLESILSGAPTAALDALQAAFGIQLFTTPCEAFGFPRITVYDAMALARECVASQVQRNNRLSLIYDVYRRTSDLKIALQVGATVAAAQESAPNTVPPMSAEAAQGLSVEPTGAGEVVQGADRRIEEVGR